MSLVSSATRSGNPEMDLGLGAVVDLAITHAHRHTTYQETQSESSKCFLPLLYYFSCLFYFFSLFFSPLLILWETSRSILPDSSGFGNGIVFTLRQCFNFCSTRSVISLPALVVMHSLLHHEESDVLTKFREGLGFHFQLYAAPEYSLQIL